MSSVNEIIANQMEHIVQTMFHESVELNTGADDYSLIYSPEKLDRWLIVIYFSEKASLLESVRNGNCYQIFNFLYSEIGQISTLEKDFTIFFEVGAQPQNKEEFDRETDRLKEKVERMSQPATGKCIECGEDSDNYELYGYPDTEDGTPTHGWMACGNEDCTLFRTWSLGNPEVKDE